MDTQSRVLAMLNKVQTVRKVNKEKLGAIEDAIKESKDKFLSDAGNVKGYMDEMSLLATDIEDVLEDLRNLSQKFSSKFDKLGENFDSFQDLKVESEYLEEYGVNIGGDWMMLSDLFEDEVSRYDEINSILKGL